MMDLKTLIRTACKQGASDLHLEPGLPAAMRVRGSLQVGSEALAPGPLLGLAREVIGEEHWPQFLERRSFDLSRTIAGVRCRINVLQSSRGVGMAIRLLASFQATLDRLNLHPELNMRVPECEILLSSHPIKAHIRSREFFKIASVIETGADSGMWTFHRYQNWLEKQKDWYMPEEHSEDAPDSDPPPIEGGLEELIKKLGEKPGS